MARSAQDALAVLRGAQLVAEAAVKLNSENCKHIWANSSVREVLQQNLKQSTECIQGAARNPTRELQKLQDLAREATERGAVVLEGLRQFSGANARVTQESKSHEIPIRVLLETAAEERELANTALGGAVQEVAGVKKQRNRNDPVNLDISSITLRELEEILSKRNKNRQVSLRTAATESRQIQMESEKIVAQQATVGDSPEALQAEQMLEERVQLADKTTAKVERSLPPVSVSPKAPTPVEQQTEAAYVENFLRTIQGGSSPSDIKPGESNLQELSKVAKQRKVPSSRIGRMASFGGLFAGLGLGTINELTKGVLGLGGSTNMREALLSPANAERIVDTLCKVRGAALKLGQILSIQDSTIVSPQLAKAFERVRQAADYMPDWQVERVMNTQLGRDWREKFATFENKPFAAASIGQVHRGTLKNGMPVAIKIQYPGVAQSIESDIDNLVGMLKVWDVFPKGFFIDNVVKVAKRELNWEVDYTREAEYTDKFKEMIAPYPDYYVPIVVKDLTTSSVLTTELVPGVPLDKCFEMSYEHRKHIGELVMQLCLRELFELQCMQTDPNWSNFLYDEKTKTLMLIDFGATRFYQKKFIKNYRNIIVNAAKNNRQGVLELSREMGFLTGYESKQMEESHIDAVMILGEVFRYDGEFDFGKQRITERIAHLVPTMVAHRLAPPPEEIYSIHRKLSGIFLLCARLNVKMNCRKFYDDIIIAKFKE